jgi:hypothetical protein
MAKNKSSKAPQPPQASYVRDLATSLGRDAKTAKERRESLKWCLENPWANEDPTMIERVDENQWKGWALWK